MQNELEHYPVRLKQNVVWGEMDAFAHVNNTVYFRYFESARIAYFERAGMMDYFFKSNVGPILANTNCNFKLPLSYPDSIQIATHIDQIWANRFNMHIVVYSEKFNAIAAEGDAMMVYYDYEKAKSCPIPKQIINTMEQLQPGVTDALLN